MQNTVAWGKHSQSKKEKCVDRKNGIKGQSPEGQLLNPVVLHSAPEASCGKICSPKGRSGPAQTITPTWPLLWGTSAHCLRLSAADIPCS